MRVVRSAGENVSPSDDGRLFAQIFDDGLFTDATFTALGTNNVQISPIYGDLCGRDFTIEQMTVQVELPEGEGTETGVIYIEIDTSSDDVITVNSALDPFTPTYEDINTNGAVAQMVIAEYTATSLGVSSVTAAYTKLVKDGNVLQNLATVESGNTASQNYAVGDYVCVNGILYKVTAAIASGQSFTVGTNIEQTNVGTELSSLNSNNEPTIISASILPSGITKKYGNIYMIGKMVIFQLRLKTSAGTPTNDKLYANLPQPAPGESPIDNDMISLTSEGASIKVETNGNVYYFGLTPGKDIFISGCYVSL